MIITTEVHKQLPINEKFTIELPWGASIKAIKFSREGFCSTYTIEDKTELELIIVKNPNRDSVKKRTFIIYDGSDDVDIGGRDVSYKCSFGKYHLFEFK